MTQPAAQGSAAPDGQATGAPAGTSAPAPGTGTSGQPHGAAGTSPSPGPSAEDILFDPAEYENLTKDLPEPLKKQAEALKKSLHGAYTKKTQTIAERKKDLELIDTFRRDPHTAIQQMAQSLGYRISKAEAKAAADGAAAGGWSPEKGDPSSWNDVVGFIMGTLQEKLGGTLKPIVSKFEEVQKTAITQQLSAIDPEWVKYEDAMMANLSKHPTLHDDPALLYRMSVPAEVLESRAVQRALAKLEGKAQSARVAGASTTTKKTPDQPDRPLTFEQAVEFAKRQVAEQAAG